MAAESQLFGKTLVHGCDPKQIFLTYDDGPNDPHTLHLLDVLANRDAKATFFVIGEYVRQRPEMLRRIAEAGHAIGNHSYTHPRLLFVSPAKLREELHSCNQAIEDSIGRQVSLFRPPFGGRRPDTLATVRKLGLMPVMWSVTSYDWKAQSAEEIASYTDRALHQRSNIAHIVLLHDGSHRGFGADRARTVKATELLLERFGSQYRFVSIG